MALPICPRHALASLVAAALLATAACDGHRRAGGTERGSEAPAAPRAEDAPRTMERCAGPPAPGTRCADALAALGGLVAGARLQGGQLIEIAVERDRLVLSLAADGGQIVGVEAARLDDDPRAPPPMARTPTMSLFVRSDVPGTLTPAWQLGLVQSLADHLSRAPGPVPAWLVPLRDRRDPRQR